MLQWRSPSFLPPWSCEYTTGSSRRPINMVGPSPLREMPSTEDILPQALLGILMKSHRPDRHNRILFSDETHMITTKRPSFPLWHTPPAFPVFREKDGQIAHQRGNIKRLGLYDRGSNFLLYLAKLKTGHITYFFLSITHT